MTMANGLCLREKEVGRYLEDSAHKAHKGQGEGDGVSPIVGAGGDGTDQEFSVSEIFNMNN